MNNFRKQRTSKSNVGASSIDGFTKRTAVPGGTPFRQTRVVPRAIKIDDFKRAEGFTPRSRSVNPVIPDGTSIGRKTLDRKEEMNHHSNTDKKIKPNRSKKHKGKRAIWKSLSSIFTVALFLAGFLVGFAYLRTSQVFTTGDKAIALECNVAPGQLTKEGDGRVNILMIGKGGPGHTAPDLTDTIIVASIDTCQKEAGLISIPRDLYVQVPGNGHMKINSVYSTYKQKALYEGKSKQDAETAGLDALEATTEEVLGVPINYYVTVDFEAFRKAVDTVGGITVVAKEPLYDASVAWENNWSSQLAVKGENNFDGKQALLYARSRHGSARGDFDRSERQRQIIVALSEKVFTLGTFSNPVKMTQLLNNFGSHVHTNLGLDDLTKLYDIAGEIDGSKVASLELTAPPNDYLTTSNIGGLSVVVPKAGVGSYASIQNYVRNKLKDGFIVKENPKILVLNGTNQDGTATSQKKVLKSYGYDVIGVADAPTKDYASTVFVDMTHDKKRYTKRYIELRYGIDAIDDLPEGIDPGLADFVIIIGQNEISNN